MPRAFVIRPFGTKSDSAGQKIDFEAVHAALIKPALDDAGLTGSTTVEIEDAGNIRADMFALILEADLVVCDITVHNANVFYELGVRHALRKKGTVLLKGAPSADTTPFDLLTDRYMAYDATAPANARAQLVRTIQATLNGQRVSDSPVFGMMPGLPEVDPSLVQGLPLHFTEEVARAAASRSKGWLRLLAEDVQGRRFERAGLRLVGREQWRLKDLEAAQESLEKIRDLYPNDVEASLSLANIYERRARPTNDAAMFAKSDQAISRVLDNATATAAQRVEALALRGRNRKTLWRSEFEGLAALDERRKSAMNQELRGSYEAYCEAFSNDLNHFWSGLGALQMGAIFLDLAAPSDTSWKVSFDDDSQADSYRAAVDRDVRKFSVVVRASVDNALARMAKGSSDALWARISQADIFFAEGYDTDRTLRRYSEVLRDFDAFGWDAVRGQLELFASLGVRRDLALAIIAAGDAIDMKKAAPSKKTVVVFAGHQPDAGQAAPRFPAEAAEAAKARIRNALLAIQEATVSSGDDALVALASAAPGGDILFHEVCAELKVKSIVCLPIPVADYVRESFSTFGDWRSRFQNVISNKMVQVLELSDRAELPTWLTEPPSNPPMSFWERGNRWVFAMAQAYKAENLYLVALWDGVRVASTGGTAHMVSLAEATSDVRIVPIDTRDLLQPKSRAGNA